MTTHPTPKEYAIAAYALEHRLTIASESVREFLELVRTTALLLTCTYLLITLTPLHPQ